MRAFKVLITHAYSPCVREEKKENIAKPLKPDSVGVSSTLRKNIKPP